MEKKTNVPKLRFPGFEGEWVEKKLGEIAERKILKNKDNQVKNVFTNSAAQGIVNQRDFFDKDIANQNNLLNYYIVDKEDFIYNPRISTSAPVGPIRRNHIGRGVMSPLYTVFKFNKGNIDFFEIFFLTTKWYEYMESIANYGARADRMNITNSDFYEMPLPFPSIPEQTKIASFLTAVDDKLTQLKKKKSLLEEYKKGVMQKIFSQELRFKDDNGDDFPEWEEKKFGDIGFFFSGGTPLTTKKDYFNGEIPFIRSGEINSDKTEQFITELGLQNSSAKMIEVGDLIYALYGATSGGVAISKIKGAINQAILCIRTNEVNSFLYYFLLLKKQVIVNTYIQGGQGNLSADIIKALYVPIPSPPEQAKIANFLSAIDEKINHCSRQIERMEDWKKGLLQQMFI